MGGFSKGEQFSSILPSVHMKYGLIKGVVFGGIKWNPITKNKTCIITVAPSLIRQTPSTIKMWPYKMGGLSFEVQISSTLLSVHLKLEGWPLAEGDL